MNKIFKFNIKDENLFSENGKTFQIEDCTIKLKNRDHEPNNCFRLEISFGNIEVELFPSKFLSFGNVCLDGIPVFWDSPLDLVDPDKIDLSSQEILINGEAENGFTFLKTFIGGLEFYGLKNWGMPYMDPFTGEQYSLHGETSNIPVEEIEGTVNEDNLEISGKIIYRDFDFDKNKIWHQRGTQWYELNHKISIPRDGKSIKSTITITNISNKPLIPEWGYHINLRPETGSRLVVPSKKIANRSGFSIPEDFELWNPASNDLIRTETGIIHKGLKLYDEPGKQFYKSLLMYPSGLGIVVVTPPVPYFQTWTCNGGANSEEFVFADSKEPVFKKNWDAQGIEFGSSALDHDDNIDHEVKIENVLKPGKSLETVVEIKLLSKSESDLLLQDIDEFNRKRDKGNFKG